MRKIKIISIMITVFAIIFGVGFKVYSSCNKDKQITVENDIIAENEKAEVFVSIHMAGEKTGDASGIETIYQKDSSNGCPNLSINVVTEIYLLLSFKFQ